MRRNVFAIVFGVVLAVILIMVVEAIGHAIFPPPTDIDFSDREVLTEYMENAPIGALSSVIVAWVIGTFAGGVLACFIAKNRPAVFAAAVGGFITLAAIATMIQIPHPTWFAVGSILAIAVTTWFAARVGLRFDTADMEDEAAESE